MKSYYYFLIPDALAWDMPKLYDKRLPTECYTNLADVKVRYQQLREQPYNYETAFDYITGCPYARLTIGIARNNPRGPLKIVEVRRGINYLSDDFYGPRSDVNDKLLYAMARDLIEVVGVDRIRLFDDSLAMQLRSNDMHITEWRVPNDIFIYVTESTFDSYSWQLVENKQKFISQIMTSKSPARSCEDLDEAALTYAEIKALAAGNPMIKEKMDLDIQVARLRTLKAAYTSQHYRLEDAIAVAFPRQIKGTEHRIRAFEQDIQTAKEHQSYNADKKLIFSIELDGKTYDKREDAGKALLGLVGAAVRATKPVPVGHYAGFEITVEYKPLEKVFHAHLVGEATHTTELGNDAAGNMIRFQNVVSALPQDLNRLHGSLEQLTKQLTNAEEELKQPFLQEQELSDKSARLAELDALLNVGNDAPIIEGEAEELEEEPEDALIQSDDELER